MNMDMLNKNSLKRRMNDCSFLSKAVENLYYNVCECFYYFHNVKGINVFFFFFSYKLYYDKYFKKIVLSLT